MFRILSIDGGGIRGVIPAVLLKYTEEQTGNKVSELFDLIVGTSTGGILAAGLTTPSQDDPSLPRYSAEEMLNLYAEQGEDIFKRSLWRGVTSIGGATEEQYNHKPIEEILNEYLGDAELKNTVKPIVVTTYDIEERQPYFFKTSKAALDDDRNHYLHEVARATSAAPTYFEPKLVSSFAPNPSRRVLIDGGVFVNNPSLCAYVEAISSFGVAPEEIMMVSLGTGVSTRKIPYEDAKDWGLLGWVRPIISVMMDGSADAADYHVQQLLRDKYYRFDTRLDLALDDLDAANAGNIQNLIAEAQQIIDEDADNLAKMIAQLSD